MKPEPIVIAPPGIHAEIFIPSPTIESQDITSIVKNVPIIRISIYEKYKGLTIEKLIDGEYRGLLIEYINMRLDGLK